MKTINKGLSVIGLAIGFAASGVSMNVLANEPTFI